MKQKLLFFLAVLLTGGMLVACGPGDETAEDAGGGVVDEPLGADPFAEPTTEADTFEEADDADVAEEADEGEPVTEEADEGEPVAEGETDEGVAGGGAAAPAGEPIVVTFSQAAEGVAVQNVEGAEVDTIATTDETNPDLNLTTGQRYEFVFDGEGDLVFYNADNEPVLSTAGDGTFVGDADVAAESEAGRLSFTLTEELAGELDRYSAGTEDQGGSINVN